MEKEYVRIQWENRPSIATPLGQINLNKMDYQIDKNENTLITFDTTKANQSDLLQTIRTLTYDTETGIFVFTFWNGSTYSVDLNIEKIPVTFSMDEYGVITMTTADGTTYTCDIGALIKLYTFVDGDEIDFVTTTDAGGNKTITASIKDGSIVGSKLQPNFLADCQAAKAQAELAATSASSDASDAELSSEDSEAWAVGERNGQPVPSTDPAYENNAKWWAQHGTGSSFAGLTDTSFTNLQNGQIAKYNSTTQKWENTEDEGGLLPHFKITSEAGSTVTVVCPDTSVITPTQTSSGIWQCDVPAYGVYTVHAVINGDDAVRSVTVDTVKEYVIHDEHYSYTLNVYAPTGSSIIVTDNGSETYTGTGAGSTAVIFALHQASTTYTITVDYDGLDSSTTITSSATTGGSGSKTITFGTINLTLDEDLIGETIVMAKGTDTVSKVASSTSMVFYPNATGNWTISCQYEGETYYSEPNPVVVSSLSTPVSAEISLIHIPEGATVLPTDDIQTWLACANITDKSYTTLAEVLADRETFETLIADSNACDYMARSTTWALAEGLVPNMTSATTPSGVTYSNSELNTTYVSWKAFNGVVGVSNDANRWVSAQGQYGTNAYLSYDFGEPTTTDKAKVYVVASGSAENPQASVIHIEGSNDNNTWIPITTKSMSATDMVQYTEIQYSSVTYRYYRAYFESCVIRGSGNDYYSQLRVFQFYKADITTNKDAMSLIGKYDYCSNALLSNATWAEAIANSDYSDSVVSPLVPKMTSNTTPSGEAFESNGYGGAQYAPWRAFDEDASTYWASYQAVVNSSVGYKSTSKVVAYFFDFAWSGSSAYLPPKIQIQGSNDNFVNDINVLGEYTSSDYPTSSTKYRLLLESFGSYQYHRCAIIEKGSIPNFQVAELQFYGRASEEVLVPLVPTMTSNTTPSGVCSGSSIYHANYDFWVAFNQVDLIAGNGWLPSSSTAVTDAYIEYQFTKLEKVTRLGIGNKNQSGSFTFAIKGSQDGQTFTEIASGFTISDTGVWKYFDFTNNSAYRYYRVYFTSASASITNGNGWKFQFYQKQVQTNIIHSAPNDYIYMLEDGVPTPICRANENGDAIFDFSELEEGVYTFGSTTAKNPNDLTEDFKKRFRITKTPYGGTTERYLLPDTIDTLYWFGREDDNLEDMSAANGWSWSSGYNGTPTRNTNNMTISGSGNLALQGVGSKNTITSSSVKCVCESTSSVAGYTQMVAQTSKNVGVSSEVIASVDIQNGLNTISTSATGYVRIASAGGSHTTTLDAFWYDRVSNDIPTFISAANDTLYIMDGNTKVYIANTNGEGKSYEPLLEAGTYTIYSSVAKDPNNLSNPYSKTVTVDESTQTIAVMPDAVKTLYWFGYMSDSAEVISNANGWSTPSRTAVNPTFNTNEMIISTASQQVCGIGTKNAITISKGKAICKATYDNVGIMTTVTKSSGNAFEYIETNSSSYVLLEKDFTDGLYYLFAKGENTQKGAFEALWYE